MSCRVFKRNLEFAMFDVLTKIAKRLKIQEIYGDFISTEKNTIVSDLYLSLGFKSIEKNIEPNKASYVINVKDYVEKNNVIEVIYDE
jgi:predicted enzyme involved in methoxymalonyl-ACP biosynthesis